MWPAAVGLLIFTWIELASGWGEHPARLATAAVVYSVLTWAGMALYGVETWTRRGEAFSVYFNLLSRLVDLREARRAWSASARRSRGLPPLERPPGTVAFVVVMIGTVTFDGLSQGAIWSDLSTQRCSTPSASTLPTRSACCSASRSSRGFYRLGIAGAHDRRRRLRRPHAGARVRALAGPDRRRLRRRALPHVPHLRGPGDPLHGLGPVRPGLGPVRLGQTPGSTTACCRRTPPGTSRSGWWSPGTSPRSCWRTTARSRSTVSPGWRCAPNIWMLGIMIGFTTLALWLLAQAGHVIRRAALIAPACSRRAAAATRRAAGRAREGALAAAGRLLEEAAVRQHARHRPRDRRLPAHHQQGLLADRRRTAARSRRSRARSPPRARPPASARSWRSAAPARTSCWAAAIPTRSASSPTSSA